MPNSILHDAQEALLQLRNAEKAQFLSGFFKTGKGQYGEGDQFLGITVPVVRQLVRKFQALTVADCNLLLESEFNEVRLFALLVMVRHFARGDVAMQGNVYRCFVRQRHRVNNWNLVDSSAPYISGPYLLLRNRSALDEWVQSPVLWDRRIALLSTFAFIRANDFTDTLRLCTLLLQDREDLMHKACGWMLREVGKRDLPALENFLQQRAQAMPRTMLRYAIEKLPEDQRQNYLKRS
jgi:3-methyladenine DNA glycosylase AlkD